LARDFYQRVYAVVSRIPEGRVTSYGAIARFLGAGKSARLVGTALKNSEPYAIPAHRVLNRQGLLTGKAHFGAASIMAELLRAEGLKVEEDQVQDFQQHFWDPVEHLNPENY